ncbi:gliding motility-associated ABC transporter ATP-binding subunit GldA [Capnocytophaga canis]|uniref:gliding motility-associated ABC transporter ATP-binding subunit GldA n=1 Tax=Capnocytophaga canis TaxID=1848903 RepID=UPI001561B728|nr:gliding motility-associated ABC transporter ATP-binding subunit GldA [Capnocytophaga canis]
MSIEVKQLTKTYGKQVAVNQINFSLNKGEITGFLGPNGAGKSTTMKMITGSLIPTNGEIFVNGIDMIKNPIEAQRNLGYLPEHNPLYLEMYVREYLWFMGKLYKNISKKRIEEIIEITGLTPESNKKIEQLSKGYRQRVGLASALIHDPEILILDEPTTGLDPNQLVEIRGIIKEFGKNKTILLSSHIMQEIQAVCDRVIVINKGNIVLDQSMKNLQNKEQTIEVAFDLRVEERFLRQIPMLKSVVNIHEFLYYMVFDTQEDMRPKLFDFANENGLKILQINHRHKDLEQLFSELTRDQTKTAPKSI